MDHHFDASGSKRPRAFSAGFSIRAFVFDLVRKVQLEQG